MALSRRRVVQVIAGAAAAFPIPVAARAAAALVRWEGFALGASCSISIAASHGYRAETILDAVVVEIERMESLFSLYRADSELMRLNRTGRLESASPDMLALLSLCDQVNRATAGKFDPAVRPLWRILADNARRSDRSAVQEARVLIGWNKVKVDGRSIAFENPGMAITLNGIAQGFATDRVAAVLRAHGCTNVLADIGEIAALGEREPGLPWRVGVAERGDAAPEREVELRDMAIATSAPLGTMLDAAARVGHIIDPDSTDDESRKWRRVSVMHSSAALADGLSTAFCLMSKGQIDKTASGMDAMVLLA